MLCSNIDIYSVFSFLDVVSLCRCAQVCKVCGVSRVTPFTILPIQDWNILALDGSNWQTMDLFDFQTAIEVGCYQLHSCFTSVVIYVNTKQSSACL